VKTVKLMADHDCLPLWFMDDPDAYGCFDPHEFGISWRLACDLVDWAEAFDGAIDRDDPGGPSPWTDAQFAEHEEQGRALAVRLARELAATGRGDVTVYVHTRAAGVVPVRADGVSG
jgi:hypothetical protein